MTDKQNLIREELAEFAHSQWSGWMKYQFNKGSMNPDGTWTMPKWAVKRWQGQMNTDYINLSDDEKDSDRSEADGMLKLINKKKTTKS